MNLFYDALGVQSVKRMKGLVKGLEHLVLDPQADVEGIVAQLKQDPMVEYAQPNYILHAYPVRVHRTSSDEQISPAYPCWWPGIPLPWGCTDGEEPADPDRGSRPALQDPPAEVNPPVVDPALGNVYALEKTGVYDAWKIHKGDKKFVVAVIDTGVDYNHEDLSLNMWRNPNPTQGDVVGYDFVHNDGLPYDDNQHGTHCAGTIGAVGDNGKGLAGVNHRVSIMAIKFLSGTGSGTTADAIRAVNYAVEHGAKVLSNSWGGEAEANNDALGEAIEKAKEKNVLFVAAAGNETNDNDEKPMYPAAFTNDNMVTVAATTSRDTLAYFSNWGAKTVHLGAPGHRIYSAEPGNKYQYLSGTSMACPFVAGAAALLWSRHPDWDYKKVKEVLLNTVDPISALAGKTVTGGRINVLKAMSSTE